MAEGCATCSGPSRVTVGMVCPDCGKDYAPEVEACLEPAESHSAPTEVEVEAGGLRVRCSAPGVALEVVSRTALDLWREADRATPRRQVGFEARDTLTAERRPARDVGYSSDADRSNWDSGRD